tara:strand:+ start:250 stop:1248 length:999 start_codon:yes stop_codon:yes gene_type:complete
MASTYTNLGVQLMTTGEKAGTWGTLTNTNWNIMEQIAGGYVSQALTSGGTVALVKSDGSTGATLATRIWKLTGALSDNAIVTVPDSIENWWLIDNASTNAYTVQVKTVSGTGVTWATTDKGTKLLYSDGTNVVDSTLGVSTDPGGSDTQIQYNNSGAFGGDANLVWSASTGLNIGSQKEIRLQDTTGGEYIGMKAAGTTTSYTLTMPAAVATSNDQILTSTTGGVLSWVDNSGGTSWQAVITAATKTAVAGEGYFIDTTSNACTVTLPAGTLGDEVTCVDYAGTFDTNNLTVTPNGSEKIQGTAASLTVAVERAGLTLAYSGAAQGWLLKDK